MPLKKHILGIGTINLLHQLFTENKADNDTLMDIIEYLYPDASEAIRNATEYVKDAGQS